MGYWRVRGSAGGRGVLARQVLLLIAVAQEREQLSSATAARMRLSAMHHTVR
jgi:hypothetical protein